jgi:predicted nucleotidyltransferase
MQNNVQLPEPYQKNIRRAVEILKVAGCTDIFLFGLLATGNIRGESDIDLAIRGCPKGKFFHLLGRLLLDLDYPRGATPNWLKKSSHHLLLPHLLHILLHQADKSGVELCLS